MNLEVHVIPVSDVERSKEFYQQPGLEARRGCGSGKRTSASSSSHLPGSGLLGHVRQRSNRVRAWLRPWGRWLSHDIKAAHEEVTRRGIDASDMWHGAPFPWRHDFQAPTRSARATDRFSPFADPDGNAWLVQEVTTRPPRPLIRISHRSKG